MNGLPYLTLFLAALMASGVVMGLRDGTMPARWPWNSHRDKNPAMFWLAIALYTACTAFLAGYAILDIANGN